MIIYIYIYSYYSWSIFLLDTGVMKAGPAGCLKNHGVFYTVLCIEVVDVLPVLPASKERLPTVFRKPQDLL